MVKNISFLDVYYVKLCVCLLHLNEDAMVEYIFVSHKEHNIIRDEVCVFNIPFDCRLAMNEAEIWSFRADVNFFRFYRVRSQWALISGINTGCYS